MYSERKARRTERVGRTLKSQLKPPHSAKWLDMSKAAGEGTAYS